MDDQRLARLLDAMLTVTGDLDLPTVLNRIVEAAAELVDARYAALGVVGEDRFLSEFVFTGMPVDAVHRIGSLPQGHGILGLLVDEPETIRLADLTTHPRSYGFPPGHPPMRSFLGTPVRVGGRVFGNLYLTEKRDGAAFTAADEELTVALAAAAGSAIERSRLHAELGRLSLLADRERIGRDLHDTVIQRLFATGLGLQAMSRRVADQPDVAARLDEAVDELDRTIRDIRTTIFALQSGDAVGSSLRRSVLALSRELEPALGFGVSVQFDGPIDTTVTPVIVEHALPVLREALTNVAKHARATRAQVVIAAHPPEFTIQVDDDGTGIAAQPPGTGLGLGNLEHRADQLGGRLEVGSSPDGGVRLRWTVPLSS